MVSARVFARRFATIDQVRAAQDKARANDEVILGAIKELDQRFHDKMEVKEQVLLRVSGHVCRWGAGGGGPRRKVLFSSCLDRHVAGYVHRFVMQRCCCCC